METLASDVKKMALNLARASSDESRTKIIQHFGTDPQIHKALAFMFDSRITTFLPQGCPPITERPLLFAGPLETHGLFRSMLASHKINYFFATPMEPKTKIEPAKMQTMFLTMMQDIHAEDRELFIAMKDKRWPYDAIYPVTARMVADAWRDIYVGSEDEASARLPAKDDTAPVPPAPPAAEDPDETTQPLTTSDLRNELERMKRELAAAQSQGAEKKKSTKPSRSDPSGTGKAKPKAKPVTKASRGGPSGKAKASRSDPSGTGKAA
jgi:hypothetical protein